MWVNFYIEGQGTVTNYNQGVGQFHQISWRVKRESPETAVLTGRGCGKAKTLRKHTGRASWLDDPPSHFRCSEQLLDLILLETLKSMQFTLSSRNTGPRNISHSNQRFSKFAYYKANCNSKTMKITWHCSMNATVVSLHALSISLPIMFLKVLWPWPHLILKQSWLNVLIHISQRHMQTLFLISN